MAKKNARRIGLAIVGGGRVGLFRGEVAARHPQVDFIGLAEIKPDRAQEVAEKIGADFVTTDDRELVARDNYRRTDDPAQISPMVISGTHALDIVMWMLEAKRPVEIYARSIDKTLGPLCNGIDATAGTITFEDGSLYHASISWALPIVWPGAVYSLDVGIVGTEGVLTIDDTHRDIVLATNLAQGEGYAPDAGRRVDFLGSYPPGHVP